MRSATAAPNEGDRRRREPRDDERVQLEVLAHEQGPEHERAERRPEERTEEDVGDRAPSLLRRIHVGRRGAREQDAAVHRADAAEPEDRQHRAVGDAAESRQLRTGRTENEAARDHGDAPDPVHHTPRREAPSAAPAARKIAGPSPRIALDAGHQDERDGRDRDRELEDARQGERGTPPGGRCYAGVGCATAGQFNQPGPEMLPASARLGSEQPEPALPDDEDEDDDEDDD